MLRIIIPGNEFFNEKTEEFVTTGNITVDLEHSLVALSKWESKYNKPFLSTTNKTAEEIIDYIKCMIIDNSEEINLNNLSEENVKDINNYIDAKMTATWFSDTPNSRASGETITSELIYYWLITYNIPFEVQNWHLNRLLTLIRICSIKNSKPKKMTAREIAARNRALNEKRKLELGTSG